MIATELLVELAVKSLAIALFGPVAAASGARPIVGAA